LFGWAKPPGLLLPPPFTTPMVVYSVNAGEFISWLNIYLRQLHVEVGANEIQTCTYALVITNRK